MRIFKLLVFTLLTVSVFLFSPILGFLVQEQFHSLTGIHTQSGFLEGGLQLGTQIIITVLVGLPLYKLLWGSGLQKQKG